MLTVADRKTRSREVTLVTFAALGAILVTLSPREACAQDGAAHEPPPDAAIEHTIVVGVGGAGELDLGDRSAHLGGNVMVEWDAIEDWLEIELGASLFSAKGGLEIPVDLLIKKPFKLARWAEVMIGVGPEVVRVTGANGGTHFGGEGALDFMFWPWGRRVGLWTAPEYDVVFRDGASSGLGVTGGVLLGW